MLPLRLMFTCRLMLLFRFVYADADATLLLHAAMPYAIRYDALRFHYIRLIRAAACRAHADYASASYAISMPCYAMLRLPSSMSRHMPASPVTPCLRLFHAAVCLCFAAAFVTVAFMRVFRYFMLPLMRRGREEDYASQHGSAEFSMLI